MQELDSHRGEEGLFSMGAYFERILYTYINMLSSLNNINGKVILYFTEQRPRPLFISSPF